MIAQPSLVQPSSQPITKAWSSAVTPVSNDINLFAQSGTQAFQQEIDPSLEPNALLMTLLGELAQQLLFGLGAQDMNGLVAKALPASGNKMKKEDIQSAEELANFTGLENSPRLHQSVKKLADFAMDWKLNKSEDPAADKTNPDYEAGEVAYKLLSSAREAGTVIVEENLEQGILGLNEGDGQVIRISSQLSEKEAMETLIHELGHNQEINDIDLGAANSIEEESVNNFLGDLVVSGMEGKRGKSLEYWHSVTAPLYQGLSQSQDGYLNGIGLALFA